MTLDGVEPEAYGARLAEVAMALDVERLQVLSDAVPTYGVRGAERIMAGARRWLLDVGARIDGPRAADASAAIATAADRTLARWERIAAPH